MRKIRKIFKKLPKFQTIIWGDELKRITCYTFLKGLTCNCQESCQGRRNKWKHPYKRSPWPNF